MSRVSDFSVIHIVSKSSRTKKNPRSIQTTPLWAGLTSTNDKRMDNSRQQQVWTSARFCFKQTIYEDSYRYYEYKTNHRGIKVALCSLHFQIFGAFLSQKLHHSQPYRGVKHMTVLSNELQRVIKSGRNHQMDPDILTPKVTTLHVLLHCQTCTVVDPCPRWTSEICSSVLGVSKPS
jgi:hypothetical protein